MFKENFVDYDPLMKKHCPYCNTKLDDDWDSDFDCNIDYHSTKCSSCGKEQWIRMFKNTEHDQNDWASEEEEEESNEKTIEVKIRELHPDKIDRFTD